jgi:hypothetical protein
LFVIDPAAWRLEMVPELQVDRVEAGHLGNPK